MRNALVEMLGRHCWLAQQCEAGARRPLLDKPAVAPNMDHCRLGHHRTSTGAPTPTPSMAAALSSTMASSRQSFEPTSAMSVMGG